MKRKSFRWLAAAFLLSAIGAGVCAYANNAPATAAGTPATAAGTLINWNSESSPTVSPVNGPSEHSFAKSLSVAFRTASQKVMPAVVTIQASSGPQNVRSGFGGGDLQGQLPEELRDNPFFRRFFENAPEGSRPAPGVPQRQGMGSGVIIDPAGIILTNNHVVKDAEKLLIKLHDGREFEAVEWKSDPQTDIAVVRIAGQSDLPTAVVGDSDMMDIGDWVIAVGAPFGLDESVTAGIISAKSRGIGITSREDFLQTDAAINPGNSGGPLVNLDGDVVGINTAISTTSGGYQGIGFAVPVNLARWVGDELMSHGTVRRAFLGVGVQPVDSSLSQQLGLKTVRGAVVTDIRSDSPAAKAGLQSGDVVLEFDGREITKPSDLQGHVERASLKDVHRLVVVRNGKTITLDVNVAPMPTTVTAGASVNSQPAAQPGYDELGLQVSDLTGDVAKQLGVDPASGVVITGVRPGSPAEIAGLADGMVVRRVGQTAVSSVGEFRTAMKQASLKDGVLLLIRNGDASRFVVVRN